jgi:hypothetical protein
MKTTAIVGPSRQRGRKTLEVRLNDINDIIHAKQRIAEAERAIIAKQRAAARARQESLERMIGAACMADRANADTFAAVRAALDKHFADDKNRNLLRAEGWLVASAPVRVKGAENE